MGPYPPRVVLALHAPTNQRSANWIGVSTSCEAVPTGGIPFLSPGCRSCSDTEGFMNRGWGPILPGLRSLYAPQPISDRPVGLGFPHRAGRCRPGRTRFSSTGCLSCRDMEGFWEPGVGPNPSRVRWDWGELPRGATLAAHASPPHWPRAGGEEPSANGIGARKTQG